MGKKGDKQTNEAKDEAAALVGALAPLGSVTSKGMFGGYGIFQQGTMFALVDSRGAFHLRVNEDTKREFEAAGGLQHGRMPYFSVPASVRSDQEELLAWAEEAVAIAQAAKK